VFKFDSLGLLIVKFSSVAETETFICELAEELMLFLSLARLASLWLKSFDTLAELTLF
jgi:hypothetical protein